MAFSGYWVGLRGLEGPPSPSPNPSAIESYMNPFQGKCRLVASPKSDSLCLYPQCVQAGWGNLTRAPLRSQSWWSVLSLDGGGSLIPLRMVCEQVAPKGEPEPCPVFGHSVQTRPPEPQMAATDC